MKENLNIRGEYKVLSLNRDPNALESSKLRAYCRGDISVHSDIKHLIQSEFTRTNICPTVGRNVLARLLAGDTTYSGEINYGALGDGTTAFTNASTQLNNEIYRKLASDSSYDDNIAYVDWFIASGDCADDTYEEFGAFIDGEAGADTGQAFSLTITGGWVKSGSMFISLKITIS